jgi:hypothetical protein
MVGMLQSFSSLRSLLRRDMGETGWKEGMGSDRSKAILH